MSNELKTTILGGFVYSFVLFLADKLLRIDLITGDWPFSWRLFLFLISLAVFLGPFYYHSILSGAGGQPGAAYAQLRAHLVEGGQPTRVYNRWLASALAHVDTFFNDAGRSDRSWAARAMRLETDGPRWTAPAFDRCLLLALLYPIVSVYVVWVFSGHVGLAEHTLGLAESDPTSPIHAMRRLLGAAALIIAPIAARKAIAADGWRATLPWLIVGISAVAFAGAGAVAVAFAVAVAGAGAGAFAVAGAVADAVAGAVAGAVAVAVVAGGVAVAVAAKKGLLGQAVSILCIVAALVCCAAAYWLSMEDNWHAAGALLLFFGVLTLVNAPFDWLAIGFTRALLRKGLSRGGAWPFAFALVDVLVAAVLIGALAFAMVVAVDLFDDLAVIRGGPGARILPLDQLFAGLETAPGAYENWWVWMLLFSSMIPSLIQPDDRLRGADARHPAGQRLAACAHAEGRPRRGDRQAPGDPRAHCPNRRRHRAGVLGLLRTRALRRSARPSGFRCNRPRFCARPRRLQRACASHRLAAEAGLMAATLASK